MFYLAIFFMCILAAAPWVFFPRRVTVLGKEERRPNLFFTILAFLPLIIFIGLRGTAGDTGTYLVAYERISGGILDNLENGYNCLTAISKSLGLTSYWHLFVVCLISCLLLIKLIYKHSDSLFLTMYYFMGSTLFFWLANGIRQFLAVCVIFSVLPALADRKALRYFIGVAIATWIHQSALIMLPIFFIVNNKPWTIEMLVKEMAFTFLFLIVMLVPPITEAVFSFFGFESYISAIKETTGGNIFNTAIALIPSIIAYITRAQINKDNNRIVNTCINLSFMAACLYFVAALTSGVYIGRFHTYFSMSNILLFPYLLKKTKFGDWQKIVIIAFLLLYLLYFIYTYVYPYSWHYFSWILNMSIPDFYW